MDELKRPFNRFFLIIVLLVATIFTSKAAASDKKDKRLELSLEEGILLVLENNIDIDIQRVQPEIEGARILKEKGAFDVEAFGSFERRDSTTPLTTRSTVAAGGLRAVESETYKFDSGLTGRTPLGTEYTLEFKDEWTADSFNNFNFEYDAFAGITIKQPLLKDFGTETGRYQINVASRNREISVHKLAQGVMETVSGFELAYWDLVKAREELKVREESLGLAQRLLERNRKRYSAGAASALEVTQAEAGVASRKEELIVARKNVREKENALKLFISKDVFSLRDVEIVPVDRPLLMSLRPELEKSIAKAMENRPDYLEAKVELEKKHIKIKYAENQKFPRLDIEASYGFNGLGGSFGDSVDDLGGNPEWRLAMVLRYPLGNNSAENELVIARAEARQAILRLKRLEQEIIVNVDNAIKEIEASEQRVHAAQTSTRLAREALKAEEVKLEAGLSTTYDVLKHQEDLAKARLSEIAAIIDYNKAITVFLKEEGTLLKERSIRIDDGSVMKAER